MTAGADPTELRVPDGLWTDLQCAFAYYASTPEQSVAATAIRDALSRDDPAAALGRLGATGQIAAGIEAFLRMRSLPGWAEGARGILSELAREMEREAARRAPVTEPNGLEANLRQVAGSLDFHRPDDILEISTGPATWVNYVSRQYSPDWRPEKGDWDRDTQFMFEMHFDKGLFIWLSAHTHPAYRGKGVGTRFFRTYESFAARCGFRRFSVLGPNNGPYWSKALGYAMSDAGPITNTEGYREIP